MNYVKVTDSWILSPYSVARFRRDNPNVSFPKEIPESTLAEFGVFPITETVAPSGDVVEEATPALIDGVWVQQWTSRDYTTEEIVQNLMDRRASMIVTPRQARLALLSAGHISNIDIAIDALEEPTKSAVKIEWEYAVQIERISPWVQAMTTALSMTDEQVDELFDAAAQL